MTIIKFNPKKSMLTAPKPFSLDQSEARNSTMKMIIKFSDIANPAKDYNAHSKWSKLVIQEFYSQGDLER